MSNGTNWNKWASLENRSLSNLIEVMADERWKRLAEQQGVAYAKTVAEATNIKVDMDNQAVREKLRRAVLDLVAGRKTPNRRRKRHVMMNVKATESMLPPFIITGTQFRPLKVWPCGATRSQVKEAHLG